MILHSACCQAKAKHHAETSGLRGLRCHVPWFSVCVSRLGQGMLRQHKLFLPEGCHITFIQREEMRECKRACSGAGELMDGSINGPTSGSAYMTTVVSTASESTMEDILFYAKTSEQPYVTITTHHSSSNLMHSGWMLSRRRSPSTQDG